MGHQVLVLQTGGHVARAYIQGIVNGLKRMGTRHLVFELPSFMKLNSKDKVIAVKDAAERLSSKGITHVLSYGCQGLFEFPEVRLKDDSFAPFFEAMGIPHLMIWTDHPHWYNNGFSFDDRRQDFLRSANNHHFLKNEPASNEVSQVMGWSNCRWTHVAECPELLRPPTQRKPDYDVVAITSGSSAIPEAIHPFLEQDDPSPEDIRKALYTEISTKLAVVLLKQLPITVDAECVRAFVHDWCGLCIHRGDLDPSRHLSKLSSKYRRLVDGLRGAPMVYFAAREVLEEFHNWQRGFYLRYLMRYLNVGIWGDDAEFISETNGWVEYDRQGEIYARGHAAIQIPRGADIEGLSHKPFQIAASASAMVHPVRIGLDDCFTPGEEYEPFETPKQALEKIRELLDKPKKAREMGEAARERLKQEHCWEHRLPWMFGSTRETPEA